MTCSQCDATLEYDEVQALADRETFERYDRLLLGLLVDAEPNFIWCSHGCGSGQVCLFGAEEPISELCFECLFLPLFYSFL